MRFAPLTIIAAFAAMLPFAVYAEDLPGVEAGKPIVQPQAEPQDGATSDADGYVKVGDWDVKVSGSIIVDIGVGDIPPPRR